MYIKTLLKLYKIKVRILQTSRTKYHFCERHIFDEFANVLNMKKIARRKRAIRSSFDDILRTWRKKVACKTDY